MIKGKNLIVYGNVAEPEMHETIILAELELE
jgi:hypothetical protein